MVRIYTIDSIGHNSFVYFTNGHRVSILSLRLSFVSTMMRGSTKSGIGVLYHEFAMDIIAHFNLL